MPGSSNLGAFGYTGQAWLPSVGVWYYKARIYSPTAGRFLQTDPIGYRAGANLYNYVLSDPVNLSDPLGLQTAAPPDPPPDPDCTGDDPKCPSIIVTATHLSNIVVSGLTTDLLSIFFGVPGSSGNATQFPGGGIGVVTGPLAPPSQPKAKQQQPPPCGQSSGGTVANVAGNVADALSVAATASAILGAEPLALAFEGGSLAASGVKAFAQFRSGDHTGAAITGVGALLGTGSAHFAGAIGGEAITAFEGRVQATGQGIVGDVVSTTADTVGQQVFCP
jgi:RHS repeat-associated protein